MKRRTLRILQTASVLLASLVAGFFSILGLQVEGWPEHHMSRPQFASAINNKEWSHLFEEGHLNPALTQALLRVTGQTPSTAQLVSTLNDQGFLAEQQINGVCASAQSEIDRWAHGCRSRPEDIEALKNATRGMMWYYWGGLPCNFSIAVSWGANAKGRAQNIDTAYGVTCL